MIVRKGVETGCPKLIASESNNSIGYYNLDGSDELLLTFDCGGIESKTLQYRLPDVQQKDSGCGQATQDCITDAYSNHGWVSVWATIQSAFIPQTAVAIAAACAVKNCL